MWNEAERCEHTAFISRLLPGTLSHIERLDASSYLPLNSVNLASAMFDVAYVLLGLSIFGLMVLYARWAARG
jgi:hypothetical protein